ncbi:MAG: nucleotidyltransferase domain-containing protein [Actinobacteria bacterium]|nr:nucleotidyltransferase domain-containing protein [Actinomycetota bacterium]
MSLHSGHRTAVEVHRIIASTGGGNVRVFGSVATGHEHDDSDIDLLFTAGSTLSPMQLGELERRLSELLDAKVDLVPDSEVRPEVRNRVFAEAVLL